MQRISKIMLVFLSVALLISLFVNIYQHSKIDKASETITQIKKEKQKISANLETTKNQNETLNNQVDKFKSSQNNKGKSQAEFDFNTVVNKFLNTMFTFEPNTYGSRKDAVKGLISSNLYKQYFEKTNYGDANNVSSKLDNVTLYTQAKQDKDMKGLAVVSFESKSGDNDWKKETDLYQLTFDTTTKQITAVQNLGTSFKASDVK